MVHREFGPKLLDRILISLEDSAEKEREGRFEGRRFISIIKPARKQLKQETQSNKKQPENNKSQAKEIKTNEIEN